MIRHIFDQDWTFYLQAETDPEVEYGFLKHQRRLYLLPDILTVPHGRKLNCPMTGASSCLLTATRIPPMDIVRFQSRGEILRMKTARRCGLRPIPSDGIGRILWSARINGTAGSS